MKIKGFDEALGVQKYRTSQKPPQARISIADQMRRARSLSKSFSLSSDGDEDPDDSSDADQLSSGSNVGNENDIVKVRIDRGDGSEPRIEFRRRATIKDVRTHTDKYVDRYFALCREKKAQKRQDWDELEEEERWKAISEVTLNANELDQLAHNLVHKLLVMSEEDPQIMHSVHLLDSMLKH